MAQKKYLTFWKVLSSWKASLIAHLVKNPSSMQDPSSIPGLGSSAGEGIGYPLKYSGASLVAQLVKKSSAGDLGLIPGLGSSPGEGKGHFSILAWRIP